MDCSGASELSTAQASLQRAGNSNFALTKYLMGAVSTLFALLQRIYARKHERKLHKHS